MVVAALDHKDIEQDFGLPSLEFRIVDLHTRQIPQ
jgi:hypothetical protein